MQPATTMTVVAATAAIKFRLTEFIRHGDPLDRLASCPSSNFVLPKTSVCPYDARHKLHEGRRSSSGREQGLGSSGAHAAKVEMCSERAQETTIVSPGGNVLRCSALVNVG